MWAEARSSVSLLITICPNCKSTCPPRSIYGAIIITHLAFRHLCKASVMTVNSIGADKPSLLDFFGNENKRVSFKERPSKLVHSSCTTVRLLTHVHCKPTHFVFHSFKANMSYSLQTNFVSVMKDWADKYHVWGTPTMSPSRSNSR